MKFRILPILLFAVNLLYSQIYVNSYRFAGEVEQPLEVEYLVVAGGGGGGVGGGGAGGYRSSVSGENSGGGSSAETPLSFQVGTNYIVTVGAGGANNGGNVNIKGGNGGNSVFSSITSIGGGGGGGGAFSTDGSGNNGGSGGGSYNNATAGTGTALQGFNGGVSSSVGAGGGGGGASSLGQSISANDGGNGGTGVASSITGTSITRSGGGGGGSGGTIGAGTGGGGNGASNLIGVVATSGAANTGGGGGGCAGAYPVSGSGGSGVVILRYPNSYSIITTSGNLEVETSFVGTDKVTTFKSGSGEIQFVEESIPNIVTNNLIAWYDASVSTSYPGTGTTWFDLSGNNYDLTLTNSSQYENVNGGVIDFENELASRTGVINTQVHTISMWFNSDNSFSDTPVQYGLIDINSDEAIIHLSSSTGGVSGEDISIFNKNPTYGRTMATGAPSLANTWYYLTLTFDGSKYLIYVNGVLYSTTSGVDANASVIKNLTNLKVGRRVAYNYYFYGKIGELYFYSDRLTEEEILLNYNNTKVRYSSSGPVWNGSQTGILDDYSGAAAAYSVRALNSNYTGPLMQVRRTDNGNTYDIYALANGNLDETYINTVCSGTNCTVQTWYDQSGNGHNATAPAANQPTIYTSGAIVVENGKPAILWPNYTTPYYLKNTSFSNLYPLTFFTTLYFNGTSNRQDYIFDSGVSTSSTRTSFIHLSEEDVNKFALYGGALSAPYYFSETNTDLNAGQKMFSLLFNSSSSYIYKNGSLTTSGASSEIVSTSMIGLTIGNYNATNTTFNWSGKIHELIIYGSNQSTNRASIESNINSYYSIY